MEEDKKQNTPWGRFASLSVGKQVGIIGSVALSFVAIIMVMMWGLSPSYRVLYNNLDGKDASAIMDSLSKQGIEYKLNESTGAILVERDRVYGLRLDMASQGLPSKKDNLDFFDSSQRMGLSKNMEAARLKKVMEIELSKSIEEINTVLSARVHIALPPNSVFSRERGKVTASVIVELSSKMSSNQVTSITSLVSRAIPRLEPGNVSIIDTSGNLLSKKDNGKSDGGEYANKIESEIENRILDILGSVVGDNNVSAKVFVEMDFSETEQTSEVFTPDSGQIRSEKWEENIVTDDSKNKGKVPGSLSNQALVTDVSSVDAKNNGDKGNISKKDGRFTKNYELDKIITHLKNKEPKIKRITVAVILNSSITHDDDGNEIVRARTEEELAQFTTLVKNTVGFNQARGDDVAVLSRLFENRVDFNTDPDAGAIPWYEQTIVLEGGKWGSVLISILLIIFLVIKPLLAHIFAKEEEDVVVEEEEEVDKSMSKTDQIRAGEENFESEMDEVRKMADEDPAIVAQVVKQWIGEEDSDDE
jgi:flagellar M-ring protein FliF